MQFVITILGACVSESASLVPRLKCQALPSQLAEPRKRPARPPQAGPPLRAIRAGALDRFELLTWRPPTESLDIQSMFHTVRDVPAYEITSFIDVEEARVDRARNVDCVEPVPR